MKSLRNPKKNKTERNNIVSFEILLTENTIEIYTSGYFKLRFMGSIDVVVISII